MSDDNGFSYPRESKEYVFFDELLVNGETPEVGDTVEYALTLSLARPLVWDSALIPPGETRWALMLPGNLTPGPWKVWVRVSEGSEETVIEAGILNIT